MLVSFFFLASLTTSMISLNLLFFPLKLFYSRSAISCVFYDSNFFEDCFRGRVEMDNRASIWL
jgi:hypothetical protein